MTDMKQKRRDTALAKELLAVEKQEKKMQQAALKAKPTAWKTELESRIPKKVYTGLESAFCKGFGLIFDQGRGIIEKGYNKEGIQADHAIRDFAVQLKGGRKELKKNIAKFSEEAKVAIRNVRRDANDKSKAMKKNSEMTEDEQKASDKTMQDLTDKFIKEIETITAAKEKEIMEI